MNRRAFLKKAARLSAVAAAGPVLGLPPGLLAAERPPSLLSVAKGAKGKDGTGWMQLVERSLVPFGGMKAFVAKRSRVVVKPNIGWDRRPEQAADTHPLVVKALVKLALDAGAREVLVFDRTCNEERRCYKSSGIKDAVLSLSDGRVSCPYVDDRKYVPIRIKRGKSLQKWSFYKDALDADVYINVPIAKHHGLARLTLGLKNVMGVIGGNRGKIHWNIGPCLADLNTIVRPALTVIDATRILTAGGPQGGSLEDVHLENTLIASVDPIAADAFATTLFGLKPDAIEATVAGHAMGLGEMALDRIRVVKA